MSKPWYLVTLIIMLIGGCSSAGDGDTATSTSSPPTSLATSTTLAPTTSAPTTSAPTTVAPTTSAPVDFTNEVREAAFGTSACFDDPACPVVVSAEDQSGTLVITTTLFRDADADNPGLALCNAAAAYVWDDFVQVLGTDGGVIASGRSGDTPLCEVR